MVSMLDGFLMESLVASRERKEALEKEIPDYSEEESFKKFLFESGAVESPKMGYMFMVLDKDCYHPGEEVTGAVFLESYRIFMQNKLACQVFKQETFPRRFKDDCVPKSVKKANSLTKVERAQTTHINKYTPAG